MPPLLLAHGPRSRLLTEDTFIAKLGQSRLKEFLKHLVFDFLQRGNGNDISRSQASFFVKSVVLALTCKQMTSKATSVISARMASFR